MWFPKQILIHNLFSHKSTIYKFENNKCVLVYGKNSTDTGADSNGSGKSGLIEAITLALTGGTCRDVDKEDFINQDGTDCIVEFHLDNRFLNKELFIKRQFFKGSKASKVTIFENKVLNDQITSVNEANKRIYELIGINREDLLNYFIIGQNSNHSFFTANDVEKKAIIARFTNSSTIDGLIGKLEKEKSKYDGEIVKIVEEILKIQGRIEFGTEQLEYQKENFEKDIKAKIKDLNEEYAEYIDEISAFKKAIKSATSAQRGLEDELSKLVVVDIEDLEKKIKNLKSLNSENDNNIDEAKKEKSKYEIILSGTQQCPKCKTEFLPKSEFSIKELKRMIVEIDELLVECDNYTTSTKKSIDKLKLKVDLANEVNDKIKKLKRQINFYKEDNIVAEKGLKKVEDKAEHLIGDIQKEKDKLESNSVIAKLKADLKENGQNLKNKEGELDVINLKTEDFKFWIYNFGKKGFQTYLANQSIKTIEGCVNSNLRKMNTNLAVLINGYTLLKSGELREKIDISILRDGKSQGSYEKYSGGEKGRINVAGIVGLHKLINLSTTTGGLNLLCLDEIFEGLDNQGQKEALKILNATGITTIVISHQNTSVGYENELWVEKIKGESILLINK